MDAYERASRLVQVLLKGEPEPTPAKIRACVGNVLKMLATDGDVSEIDPDKLTKELETKFNIWVDQATVLQDPKGHEAWLPNRRIQIDWRFWKRYEQYLEDELGWAPQTVTKLGEFTDLILEKLEDPNRPGTWDRRGMVVGNVQSGKTSNYIALMCKAVDAGYKLVIVLAGLHKNLRSQTQLRIDEGFLGFDTQKSRRFDQTNLRIGVGAMPAAELLIAHSLTSSEDLGDFNKRVANQIGVVPGGKDPVVLVVKKNRSVLENLLNWALSVRGTLDQATGRRIVRDVPLLVIDDEADNASINTNPKPRDENGNALPDQDVTAINRLIRELLSAFDKTAYVGYTATPFANIFIYPVGEGAMGEDLFPRSFIINLRPPSNYLGPAQVFGVNGDGLPIIRIADDFDHIIPNGHKKDHDVAQLPGSLKLALRAFILAGAVRICRGQDRNHHSMLVHVTRFNAVQSQIAGLIQDELAYVRQLLEYKESKAARNLVEQLRELWRTDFAPTTPLVAGRLNDPSLTCHEWRAVERMLFAAAARISVKTINGSAKDALEYYESKDGLWVIAVGGDKLSRGLTLEGLTVSYFLRASRMYDTLMQMGRWFGYRPGYADLCRLHTSQELADWYRYITFASEELREEFDHMAVFGATPMDYGLRVRQHPDGLLVTAVNKMRTGTPMSLSYQRSISETVVFDTDPTVMRQNLVAFENLFRLIGEPEKNEKRAVWQNVSGSQISQFLSGITTHPESCKAQAGLLKKYINAQLPHGELSRWTVALISSSTSKRPFSIATHQVGLITREPLSVGNRKYSIGRLVSPADEMIDLNIEQTEAALAATRKHFEQNPGKYKRAPEFPSGPSIRDQRPPESGLLLVYPIDGGECTASAHAPLMGFALSFPASSNAVPVDYVVNNIYWEQEFGAQ